MLDLIEHGICRRGFPAGSDGTMPTRKPRCFVAMAFDRDDTELLWSKGIRPVLRRNGVVPVIINRQQSNDDLNLQIMGQLDRADLCVTDLTYARPSVYYEAGYAQRTVPVIYTVRRDHLGKNQSDDLRVHFDLHMKPIIPWVEGQWDSFCRALEKRLRATFLRAWTRQTALDARTARQREHFARLSQEERIKALREAAAEHLRDLGFGKSLVFPFIDGYFYSPSSFFRSENGIRVWPQTSGKAQIVIAVRVTASFSIAELRAYQKFIAGLSSRVGSEFDDIDLTSARIYHLLLSLSPIRDSSLMRVMPHLRRTSGPGVFLYPGTKASWPSKPVSDHILCPIGNVQSLEEFRDSLGDVFRELEPKLFRLRK